MKDERIRNMDMETLKDIVSSWDGTSSKFVWEGEVLHEDDVDRAEAELDKRRDFINDHTRLV